MEKMEGLAGQLAAQNDKYLRLAAEYDNYPQLLQHRDQLLEDHGHPLLMGVVLVSRLAHRPLQVVVDLQEPLDGVQPGVLVDGLLLLGEGTTFLKNPPSLRGILVTLRPLDWLVYRPCPGPMPVLTSAHSSIGGRHCRFRPRPRPGRGESNRKIKTGAAPQALAGLWASPALWPRFARPNGGRI